MSTKKLFLILFISVVFLLTYLYFSDKKPKNTESVLVPTQETPNTIEVTLEKNGSDISIKNGDTVDIYLEGNITTGYSWELGTLDSSYLVQVGDMEYKLNDTKDQAVAGAPGVFRYSFKAVRSGETSLQMLYQRPWEKDIEPESTFFINIKISE